MGLRCLLSHDFGEPELEREREEQGNEVVITVNEVKTCSRCGERRVVSENTEVTSMEQLTATATATDDSVSQPAEADQADAPAAAATADGQVATADGQTAATGGDTGVTIDSSGVTDDAEVLTDDTDDTATDASPSGEPEDLTPSQPDDLGTAEPANMTVDDVESAAAESVQSADDDGVILPSGDEEEEADEEPDREPGEWPEYDTGEDSEGDTEWPDVEGDDEGYSAEEPPEDGPEDMTFGGGFTPEITKSESGSVPEADAGNELSFTRAEEANVEYEPTVDDIQTEFYCPECGLARLSGNSSMRAGDICPDCKRGYISERPR